MTRCRTSRWNALAWILLVLSWVIAGFVLWFLFGRPIAASSSAPDGSSAAVLPRPAQSGTPHVEPAAPYAVEKSGGSSVTPAAGGVPPSYAVLGAMVEAELGSVLTGKASWMPEKFGRDYLAMRIPKGTRVRICAATCWDAVVMDYGPSKRIHPDRIADIAVVRWEQICNAPRSQGICEVTVEYGGGPRMTLPPTDEETP